MNSHADRTKYTLLMLSFVCVLLAQLALLIISAADRSSFDPEVIQAFVEIPQKLVWFLSAAFGIWSLRILYTHRKDTEQFRVNQILVKLFLLIGLNISFAPLITFWLGGVS